MAREENVDYTISLPNGNSVVLEHETAEDTSKERLKAYAEAAGKERK